jgi:pilus assembly protein Flp/PilA
MRNWLSRCFVSDRGATAIEYALIAGFIAVAIVAVVGSIGSTLNQTFEAVAAGF